MGSKLKGFFMLIYKITLRVCVWCSLLLKWWGLDLWVDILEKMRNFSLSWVEITIYVNNEIGLGIMKLGELWLNGVVLFDKWHTYGIW